MFAFLHRLFTPSAPEPLRLSARVTTLENLADDLDSRLDYLAAELKKVRGRQFASEKPRKDDVESTNAEEPSGDGPAPARPYFPSAFLSRRFRGF